MLERKKGKMELVQSSLIWQKLEWNYLHSVTWALGFSDTWINLIMKCVLSVSFSVRVNGVFSDTRGIRQGNPMWPYLLYFSYVQKV
jgi:hypothetical protein